MNKKIVVMGVSGCGKSAIGMAIAQSLGLNFQDGDDYHPPENVRKMQAGIPLTDADRQSWLYTLNAILQVESNIVLACSALTPAYRDILREDNDKLIFVYLKGDYDLIWSRLQQRKDHYFSGENMLKSQYTTLIEPLANEAIIVDINKPIPDVLADITGQLQGQT